MDEQIDYLSAFTCALALEELGVFADVREMVDWVMACALPNFMDGQPVNKDEETITRVTVETNTRGTQLLWVKDAEEVVCRVCKGRGRWDSCFDCGNRGTNPK